MSLWSILRSRLRQGRRTVAYPAADPVLPDRFRGAPEFAPAKCTGCGRCAEVCPVGAVGGPRGGIRLDLGACLFCGECAKHCPSGALSFGRDWRLAARRREDLVAVSGAERPLAEALEGRMLALFGRSLKLRAISAGGCNACEADVRVLTTVVFDLGRFGIEFVASPRHADGILVTGPVTENMRLATRKTWDAVPGPKLAIAVGACAIAGGPCRGRPEIAGLEGAGIPVDLWIPGCPPHPVTMLDGLLRLLGHPPAERRIP